MWELTDCWMLLCLPCVCMLKTLKIFKDDDDADRKIS